MYYYYMFVKIEQRDDNHNLAAMSTLYNFYRKYLSNAKSVDQILDSDDIYIHNIYSDKLKCFPYKWTHLHSQGQTLPWDLRSVVK